MTAGPDFRGQVLDGHDFSGQDLHGGQFQGASLRGANFREADVSGADFSGCDLARADFSSILAYGAKFVRARLRELRAAQARLSFADLTDADLSGACLDDAQFEAVIGPRADLRGARLHRAGFYGGDLKAALFDGADLSEARLHHCDLGQASFRQARLRGARFIEPRLEGAVFDGALLPDGRTVPAPAPAPATPPAVADPAADLPGLAAEVEAARQAHGRQRDANSRAALASAWRALLAHPGLAGRPLAVRLGARAQAASDFLRLCMDRPELQDLRCALAFWRDLLDDPALTPARRLAELETFTRPLLSKALAGWPAALLGEAVGWQRVAIAGLGLDEAAQAQALYELGNRLRTAPADPALRLPALDLAVDCHRAALATRPAHPHALAGSRDHDRSQYLDTLAVDLMRRYDAGHAESDLDEAIRTWQDGLQAVPAGSGIDPGHRADFAFNLGAACLHRQQRHPGAAADLDAAVDALEQALKVAPGDWSARPLAEDRLAAALTLRGGAATPPSASDLDRAVALRRARVKGALEPDGRAHQRELIEVLAVRYDALGTADDLEEALREAEALARLPVAADRQDGPDAVAEARTLAALHHRQAERTHRPEAARAAIDWSRRALERARDAPAEQRGRLLWDLARRLRLGFRIEGDPALIDDALERARDARALMRVDDPQRALLLAGLGSDCLIRAGLERDPQRARGQADEGIDLLREAVALAASPPGPAARWLMNLATALHARFRQLGSREDLGAAIDAWRGSLRQATEDPADALRVFCDMASQAPAELGELLVADHPGLESLVEALRGEVLGAGDDLHRLNLARTALASTLAEIRSGREDSGPTLDEAIGLARAALESAQSLEPQTQAILHDLLCRCLASRPGAGRPRRLEQAVRHGQAATAAVSRAATPELWAACQTNLANAYLERVHGERAENIELALAHFRRALTVRRRRRHPLQWAILHNGLGIGHMLRAQGRPAHNVDRAIRHFRLSLQVRTREVLPGKWADTVTHLANAYRERRTGSRADNLEEARRLYEQALTVRTREDFPRAWALCQNNLGCILLDRESADPAEDARRARACFDQALDIVPRGRDPWLWSSLHRNAAQAEVQLGHVEAALDELRRAWDGFAAFPQERAGTGRRLGELLFEQGRWEEAHEALAAATAQSERVFAQAYTPAGRRAELAEVSDVHAMAAWCLLELGRPAQALERLEAGKARLLSQALALQERAVARLPPAERAALLRAAATVRSLEDRMQRGAEGPAADDLRGLARALGRARNRLARAWAAARGREPGLVVDTLRAADILGAIPPGSALVAPMVTSRGCAVFVLPGATACIGAEHVLRLPALTLASLRALLARGRHSWLGESLRAAADPAAWSAAVLRRGRTLWKGGVGAVVERLARLGAERALVMPQAGLGLLPLHAAWRRVQGQRRFVLDDFEVTYLPSAAVLVAARTRAADPAGPPPRRLLVAAAAEDDLVFAGPECRAIARWFPEPACLDDLDGGEPLQASHLHFACHGRYDWDDVLQSRLDFAGGRTLTLGCIGTRLVLTRTELVVLSACDTGRFDLGQSPDEYVGLPAGFLAAGAGGVISTLWPVADLSTLLLMERFYHLHLGQCLRPAAALREAQRWLRGLTAAGLRQRFAQEEEAAADGRSDLPLAVASACFVRFARAAPDERPFAHAVHWAAFTCHGL